MIFGNISVLDGHLLLAAEILAVLLATLLTAKSVNKLLQRIFRRKSRRLRIDETQFVVLRRVTVFTIYLVGCLYALSLIPGFASLGTSLLASAGILALILGFAAQHAFSNVISGIFIAIFEPFRVGDKIKLVDEYGTVEDITLRHTIIKTWQEKRIVVPNSKISEESIVNYSLRDPRILGTLEVGISYDSDIDKARKIMVEEALKHPDIMRGVKDDENAFLPREEIAKVRLVELSDFAQVMRLYYWAPDKTKEYQIRFDLTEAIKKRFDRDGIEVPFPYRTIVYKKDIGKPKR
ncbi:MAG: mechanosensitive ion channel [Candidatus Altiarchaeales archaeon]|nr:mechanosensitive ion channel [Candidatus Altiarchaeales archaeon]MBD3415930.1 mechanosensitive ion channel [Candidatus Altiarchaeales archaeon]